MIRQTPFNDFRIPISFSMAGFYILSLLFFKWNIINERTLYIYSSEFAIVIYISILLSLILPYIRKFRNGLIVGIFIIKFILCWYCAYPLGENINVEAIITSILILELLIYGERFGPGTALFLIVSIYIEQRDTIIWNREVTGPDLQSKILMLITLFSVYLFSLNIRYVLFKQERDSLQVKRLDKSIYRLTQANIDFQEHAINAGKTAEENERKRLSREIHDIAGYTLTNIIMMTESATDFAPIDSEKTKMLLEESRKIARKGLEEIRLYLRELRNVGQKSVITNIQRIKELTNTFSHSTGINIILEFGNAPASFGNELDKIVYHLIQEGMVNAFRHGHCSEIRILFWCDQTHAKISLSDNGKGAQENLLEGIGMTGMKERLSKVGGNLYAANTPTGFEISMNFPRRN